MPLSALTPYLDIIVAQLGKVSLLLTGVITAHLWSFASGVWKGINQKLFGNRVRKIAERLGAWLDRSQKEALAKLQDPGSEFRKIGKLGAKQWDKVIR